MNVGDTVKVLPQPHGRQRESYPWLPDLVGCQGIIVKIVTETPISHDPLDEPIYVIRFDPPFQVGVVPEGSGYNYHPVEWREETDYWFLEEYIEVVVQ